MDASLAAVSAQVSMAQGMAMANRQRALNESMVSDADKATFKAKSKEFETFYLNQFLDLITPENQSVFSGGVGEQMFKHQMNEEIAKSMTKSGGFGISNMVYNELVQHQATANASRLNAYTAKTH